jgi:Xaa-Pro aminopeptidase
MTPAREVAARLEAFRRRTPGATRVVHGRPNIRYLTGYDGGGATPWLIVDDYTLALVFYTADEASVDAVNSVKFAKIPFTPDDDPFHVLGSAIAARNGNDLVGDLDWWTAGELSALNRHLSNGSEHLRELRVVKSQWEQDQLRAAGAITAATMQHVERLARESAPPRELAGAFFAKAIELGSDAFTYIPYLSVGKATHLNHTTWDWAKLWNGTDEPGGAYLFEFATCSEGYGTPLSHSYSDEPDAKRALGAIESAIDHIRTDLRPGADPRALHRVMVDAITRAEFKFAHRTGYSIGLGESETWMEGNLALLGPRANYQIAAGMAFHVVGSVVIAGRFGVARSNSVLVTADGCEVLAA